MRISYYPKPEQNKQNNALIRFERTAMSAAGSLGLFTRFRSLKRKRTLTGVW